MKTVRLVLAVHNHQPVGNFDEVVERAYQDSYRPFLELASQHSGVPFVLHTSGSLLEWLVEHRPEYVEQLRGMVEAGQVEIMGGGFYEPILTMIPPRDRLGQIRTYSDYLAELFGTAVRGMWVPERVWEQSLTSDIAEAGIQYTVLDDTHFRFAGLERDALWGYYLTEDSGKVLRVFSGSEKMRYLVPFRPVDKTIAFLRELATDQGDRVVVLADDGEKFGTWPGTHEHVYTDGWLEQFLTALLDNADWLRVETFSRVLDSVSPVGKIYLPDASYREMTEWVLPAEPQKAYRRLCEEVVENENGADVTRFLRGGFWRNFKVKYPEADEMYTRMLEVSALAAGMPNGRVEALTARTELYRAQCNCAYWHGAFGGLYLPHLRNAIYRRLIAAEVAADRVHHNDPDWISCRTEDLNLDGSPEVRLANAEVAVYVKPAEGGHLYELDLKRQGLNLLATLSRRPEAYHDDVVVAAASAAESSGEVASIHDMKAVKQPDLDKKLVYDPHPRKALIDHFFAPDETVDAMVACRARPMGDFVTGRYEFFTHRSGARASATLVRQGIAYGRPIRITKEVTLRGGQAGLDLRYELTDLDPSAGHDAPIHFGTELNFAALPGGDPDRFFWTEEQGDLGPLDNVLDLAPTGTLRLVDRWQDLQVVVTARPAARFWTMPIQTVSQSESGFELVHQSTAVIPHWHIQAGQSTWKAVVRLDFKPVETPVEEPDVAVEAAVPS